MNLNKVIATVCVGVLAVGAMAQGAGAGGGGGRGQGRMMMQGGRGGMMNPAMILVMPSMPGGGGGGGARGGFGMGNLKEDIEADLKITDEQRTKLEVIRDENQKRMMEMFTGGGGGGANGGGGGGGRGFQISDEQRKQMEKAQEETVKKVNEVLTPAQQSRIKQIGYQIGGAGMYANEGIQKDLGITAEQKAKIDDLFKKQQEANAALREKMQAGEIDRAEIGERMQNNNKILNEEIQKVLTDAQKAKIKEMSGPEFKRTEG